jgi:hypothetical protein
MRRLALTIFIVLLSPSLAADPLAEASRCAGLASDESRLACYDAVFGRSTGAAAVASPSSAPAPTPVGVAAASAAPVDAGRPDADFGLSTYQKAQKTAAGDTPSSMRAGIESVSSQRNGYFVVTLDNGQTWYQVESHTLARVKAGDQIEIKRAAMGSFLLMTANGVAVRVKRLR